MTYLRSTYLEPDSVELEAAPVLEVFRRTVRPERREEVRRKGAVAGAFTIYGQDKVIYSLFVLPRPMLYRYTESGEFYYTLAPDDYRTLIRAIRKALQWPPWDESAGPEWWERDPVTRVESTPDWRGGEQHGRKSCLSWESAGADDALGYHS